MNTDTLSIYFSHNPRVEKFKKRILRKFKSHHHEEEDVTTYEYQHIKVKDSCQEISRGVWDINVFGKYVKR